MTTGDPRFVRTPAAAVCILAAILALASPAWPTCDPQWARGLFPPDQLNDRVIALCVYDDGTGPALYAGGFFTQADSLATNRIGRWRNGSWSTVGSGMNNRVHALAVYDDGTGPALYAGGSFTTAGGVAANNIARWKNGSWSAVGGGMGNYSYVSALAVYDDGTGPALYAGGNFHSAGGVPVDCVARWKDGSWSAMGSCLGDTYAVKQVAALAVYDDGTGPALYAGGVALKKGGFNLSAFVARWRDGSWSALGYFEGQSRSVMDFAVHDDGTGPALYAGGCFTTVDDITVNGIARWANGSWSAVGSEMGNCVGALAVYDDRTGPALYAGGSFGTAGDIAAYNIARWRNGSWSAVGGGVDGEVGALAVHDDGTGPALYAGGNFTTAGDFPSGRMARWGCESATDVTDVAAAKALRDSTLVSLTGPASTAVFGDTFYVESSNRCSGIRVDLPGYSIARDREVSVTGRIRTNPDGERYISGFTASDLGPLSADPLGLNLKTVGGGNWHYDPTTGAGQQGVIDGYGLCNIGLLVRCSGGFVSGGSSWFYVDDGSPMQVLVTVPPEVIVNPAWQHVSVTGISTCTRAAEGLYPLIRVREQGDITAD